MNQDVLLSKLKKLRVSPPNLKMVDYWLSLSPDGTVPRREAFDPTAASELLRGCALFDVKPGKSVHCRIAGMVLKLAFGSDIAGKDWLEITPPRHRRQRMIRYSAVAQGAIGVGRRIVIGDDRDPETIEEVMLPFADVCPDGTRPVLVHTDWVPEGDEWFGIDTNLALTLAEEFHLVPLD